MKTLKRTLVLLLVLAMSVSLFSVSAFAANYDGFEDAGEINEAYLEAVDVMTGIGVIKGIDTDTFAPTGTFTREQGAKIAAWLMLGEDADTLQASAASFTDVPADSWAAGYIDYCVEQGIINGRGDGTFDPYATLTDVDFLKMLLGVVGYGAKGEYTGDRYASAVQAAARNYGLLADGQSANLLDAAERQEATLYAFNTLWVEKVVYVEFLNAYRTLSQVDANAEDALVADVFGLAIEEEADDFGRAAQFYYVDANANGSYDADEEITDKYATGDLLLSTTVEANVATGDLTDYYATLLGVKAEAVDAQFAASEKVYINNTSDSGDWDNTALKAGDAVELYVDDAGLISDIVIARATLVAVTSVVENVTAVSDYDVTLKAWTGAGVTGSEIATDDADLGDLFAAIDADDYAADMITAETYYFYNAYLTGTTITAIEAIDVAMTGSVSEYNAADNSVLVAGETYVAATGLNVSAISLGDDYTYAFYMVNGAIIGWQLVEEVVEPTDYAYVIGGQTALEETGDLFTEESTTYGAAAKIVTTDGDVAVVNLPTRANADATGYEFYFNNSWTAVADKDYAEDDGTVNGIAQGFYSYTIDEDGAYEFEAIAAPNVEGDNLTIAEGKARITINAGGTQYGIATADTTYSVIAMEYETASPYNFKAVTSVTTYTGYANFPATEYVKGSGAGQYENLATLLIVDEEGYTTDIIVVGVEEPEDDSVNLAIYLGEGNVTADGQLYKFFETATGKISNYYLADAMDVANLVEWADGGVYAVYAVADIDEDNKITLEEATLADTDLAVATAYATYIAASDSNPIYFAEAGAAIYDVSDEDSAKWAAASIEAGDVVAYVVDNSDITIALIVPAAVTADDPTTNV